MEKRRKTEGKGQGAGTKIAGSGCIATARRATQQPGSPAEPRAGEGARGQEPRARARLSMQRDGGGQGRAGGGGRGAHVRLSDRRAWSPPASLRTVATPSGPRRFPLVTRGGPRPSQRAAPPAAEGSWGSELSGARAGSDAGCRREDFLRRASARLQPRAVCSPALSVSGPVRGPSGRFGPAGTAGG